MLCPANPTAPLPHCHAPHPYSLQSRQQAGTNLPLTLSTGHCKYHYIKILPYTALSLLLVLFVVEHGTNEDDDVLACMGPGSEIEVRGPAHHHRALSFFV